MKNLLKSILFVALSVSIAQAQETTAKIKADLIGLGLKPEVSNYLATVILPNYTSSGLAQDLTFTSGYGPKVAVAIITPSINMTPAAASNLSAQVNRLVAGSPTLAAVHLPAATARAGKSYAVVNEGSNPVLIFGSGANTLNAGAAGTPVSCASGKICDCLAVSTSKYQCGSK